MDAVVLAAGDGQRLAGVMPAGLKPLLVVNGESMIVHVTKRVLEADPFFITYVVSPTNAGPIIDVLHAALPDTRAKLRFIVQPKATGPTDALALGVALVSSSNFVMACADNIIPEGLVREMSKVGVQPRVPLVPVAHIGKEEGVRYTRVWTNQRRFYYTDSYASMSEWDDTEYIGAWIGPLVLPTDSQPFNAKTFAEVLNFYQRTDIVESTCLDVGVPQ